jgi:signal transduction histidine kinase
MFSKKKSNFSRTVSFRLTLWFAVIFSVLWLLGGVTIDSILSSHLGDRIDVQIRNTAKEFASLYATQSLESFTAELQHDAEARGVDRMFSRLLSPEGEVIVESDMTSWKDIEVFSFLPENFSEGSITFKTVSLPMHTCRVRLVFLQLKSGHLIQIGRTLLDNEELIADFRQILSYSFVLMIVCGVIAGWILTKRAMSGVERVSKTAVQISRGNIDLRVSPGREGLEIENLALSFNKMLDWIKLLINELIVVTDNIAHDLRSPITRIRVVAETSLSQTKDIYKFREMAGIIIEECDRLVELINTMLEISQTDAGVLKHSNEIVDIEQLVGDAYDIFKPVAEDTGIRLTMEAESPLAVSGETARLQRVVANILDNAIKNTDTDGQVTISAKAADSKISIEIRDTGRGIAEKDLPHIFERFYRGEKSRSTPGNGLGLSLARSIIQAHGGDISATSSPGHGSTFTILLPSVSSS